MELLKEHFDTALDTPDGIGKLRELILTLAMQGKLVPQDPGDQPASELLEKVRIEKERLISEGQIKRQKELPEIKSEEIPYEVPDGWEWVRLDNLVSILGDGLHGTPNYDISGKYYFINGNNLNNGIIKIKENTKKVSIEEFQKYKKNLNERTVLVSINGTIGNVSFYNNEKIILGKSACYFNLLRNLDKQFFLKLIKSNYFLNYAITSATGTTIKNVSLKTMRALPVPLSPITEQKNIVKKINQLMTLCDDLEKLRNQRNEKRLTVHTAAINQLLSTEDSQSFASSWSFITGNFNSLYSVKKNVAELKKVILQLAMMGKLVPQDPDDQPAAELLEEIRAEKERLIAEGNPSTGLRARIKRQKELREIKAEEIPYDLPEGWEWCSLREIGSFTGGGTPSKYKAIYWNGDILWVSPKDMKSEYISDSEMKITMDGVKNSSAKIIPSNSILIVARSGILKRKLPVAINQKECTVNQDIKVIIPFNNEISEYIKVMLQGFEKTILSKLVKQGMTVQSLEYTKFENHPFPFPPISEQKRIINRIDHFMELCDELEKQIGDATEKKTALLNAVVAAI